MVVFSSISESPGGDSVGTAEGSRQQHVHRVEGGPMGMGVVRVCFLLCSAGFLHFLMGKVWRSGNWWKAVSSKDVLEEVEETSSPSTASVTAVFVQIMMMSTSCCRPLGDRV